MQNIRHKSTKKVIAKVEEWNKLELKFFEDNPEAGIMDFIKTIGVSHQCYYKSKQRYAELQEEEVKLEKPKEVKHVTENIKLKLTTENIQKLKNIAGDNSLSWTLNKLIENLL